MDVSVSKKKWRPRKRRRSTKTYYRSYSNSHVGGSRNEEETKENLDHIIKEEFEEEEAEDYATIPLDGDDPEVWSAVDPLPPYSFVDPK